MAQQDYNNWIIQTPIRKQEEYCGNDKISKNELYFIEKYADSKTFILDIGCGTGFRTFPLWRDKELDFVGVEKFHHLIENSMSPEKIILADLTKVNFNEIINEKIKNRKTIAFAFGGVINGVLEKQDQKIMWQNINNLLDGCQYILIDTLTNFEWFENGNEGRAHRVANPFPLQYFYSSSELKREFHKNNLEIHESKIEDLGLIKRIHYLLKRK